MRLLVGLSHTLGREVRVHLGRRQRLVSQQLLHRPEVRAVVQQVRGEAVPERVRADVRVQLCLQQLTSLGYHAVEELYTHRSYGRRVGRAVPREYPERVSKHVIGEHGAEEDVRPAGLVVRRLRHEQGWGPRALIDAITEASFQSTGMRATISPNQLRAIEEHNEPVPYETLCLVAAGLGCDPVDILGSLE